MIAIVVTERGGTSRRVEVGRDEATIGRVEDNDVVLPKPNVSKHHAKIVRREGGYLLCDLGSTNGTYLNGRKIDAPAAVTTGDEVYLGDFALALTLEPGPARAASAAAVPSSAAPPSAVPPSAVPPSAASPSAVPPGAAPEVRVAAPIRRTTPGHGTPSDQGGGEGREEPPTEPLGEIMHERARSAESARHAERIVPEVAPRPESVPRVVGEPSEHAPVELDALTEFYEAPGVREIVVEGPSRILVDRGEGLRAVPGRFSSPASALAVASRLLALAGATEREGIVDARLPSGARLHVVLPPVARDGPLLSIRFVLHEVVRADSLVGGGLLSQEMLELLTAAVRARVNVLVTGPAAGGVSTLLSLVALRAGEHERLVTIERTPSLALGPRKRVALDRAARVPLATLLDAAARLRPDLVVVDDVAGDDALAFLEHSAVARGVLAGMHAPAAIAALEHLEALASLALGGAQASLAALVAQAIRLVVHVEPTEKGVRRVRNITELRGARNAALQARELFRYDGVFRASGEKAAFLQGG